jgi:hypothetical protein
MTIKFAEQKIHEARQRVAALNRELADLRRSHARSGARGAANARGKPGLSRTAMGPGDKKNTPIPGRNSGLAPMAPA